MFILRRLTNMMQLAFVIALALTILGITGTHGYKPHRREDSCVDICNNINSAVTSCSAQVECFCPTFLSSGSACSSCLATVDADSTLATSLGSIMSRCTVVQACQTQCSNIFNVPSVCNTNTQCVCSVFSDSGLACSACLASVGDITAASNVSTILRDCAIATQTTLCHTPCSNVYVAVATCSNSQCFCSIFSASGAACSSCFEASGYPTIAASISSYLATSCPKPDVPCCFHHRLHRFDCF